MIRFFQMLLLTCFLLATIAHADSPPQPVQARPMSEAWGEEYEAAGNYRQAFRQYCAIYQSWQLIDRGNAKRGILDRETQEHLERLLKKIARTLEKLNPPPAIPEGAVFAAEKGRAFFKLAKDVRDFKAAAEQFELALGIAPEVGDYHFNLAVSQKSAGQLEAALRTARLAAILARDKTEAHEILALRAEIEAMLTIQNRGR
jgi:tetratricopeptide (TPR) repeat protein